ncbi:MAG: hypothetical protein HY960_11195 [Ignavibacteriae bacterium]|nr:hypothetical protein [Ignavibacteriota bacterium]
MTKNHLFIISLLLTLLGCKSPTDTEPQTQAQFPEVFIESGTDSDSSYMSLRTARQGDGTMKTEVTGWGVEEYGLFLDCKTDGHILFLNIMGICGTVTSETYVKKTFAYMVPPAAEDTLSTILFTNFRDTLTVVKR